MPYSIVFPFDGAPLSSPQPGKPCSADKKVTYDRIDAGVDMNAPVGANVYAAADGIVQIHSDPNGFGTYPVLMLDKEIVLDNQVGTATGIYYGHVTAAKGVITGTRLKANDVIANTTSPPGGNATVPGWLEIGFWNAETSSGPIGHPTAAEAATTSGAEMYKALFGDITAVAGGSALSAASPGGNGSSDSSSSSSTDDATAKAISAAQQYANSVLPAIDDPRDNRPFSPWFLGQVMGPWPGASLGATQPPGTTGPSGQGGFRWYQDLPNLPPGTHMPYVNLVRGGMTEIPNRTGGRLSVYFMMSPESIASSINIDPSMATPDSLTTNNQSAEYITTAQSITFTLWFNRMYEVWMGDMPGPSDEGVRWDIRAIERLVGLYDAVSGQNTSGLSKNMPVSGSAGSYPVQIVFGGSNSLQFQGRVQSLDYTYTRFDANMIPVEASVDVGVMRVYNPPANADLVAPLLLQSPQVYDSTLPYTNWGALSLANKLANPPTGVINPVTGQP